MVVKLKNRLERCLLPLICFGTALNALLPAVWESLLYTGFTTAILDGFGHSYVIWICLILAIKVAMRDPFGGLCLSLLQWLCIAILCLLLVIPSAMLSWVICILLCLLWRMQSRNITSQCLAVTLLTAIAVRDPVCQSFLHLFAEQILTFDAWLSGIILWLFNNPAILSGNTIAQPDGHTLLVLTGCSAFTNLSLALLLWFSFSLFHHQKLQRADLYRALLLIILILAINATRLSLMALDPHWYQNLHQTHSQELFEFLTICIALLCIRRSRNHETYSNRHHISAYSDCIPLHPDSKN